MQKRHKKTRSSDLQYKKPTWRDVVPDPAKLLKELEGYELIYQQVFEGQKSKITISLPFVVLRLGLSAWRIARSVFVASASFQKDEISSRTHITVENPRTERYEADCVEIVIPF